MSNLIEINPPGHLTLQGQGCHRSRLEVDIEKLPIREGGRVCTASDPLRPPHPGCPQPLSPEFLPAFQLKGLDCIILTNEPGHKHLAIPYHGGGTGPALEPGLPHALP